MVRERIMTREMIHLSVFALGPMPLLIKLGRLLGDIVPADVHQLHRAPSGWNWANNGSHIEYEITKPRCMEEIIAQKLAISEQITDDLITAVLGENVSIRSLTAKAPRNDVMLYPEDPRDFRRLMRGLYDEIEATHGEGKTIHVG
jgi:hypothetical protein